MKRKWWLLGGAAVAAALLSLCFFGVRVRVAPRLILTRALGSALAQLEERFADSPAHLLTDSLDSKGRQQATLQLETEQEHLGIVRYDMAIQTQLAPNRIQAEGTVVTGGKALDLSLYLDPDFAAVSSRSLVEGAYYGITYDSFPQDVRSRELLAVLIGEKIISQWEESVSKLKEAMSTELSLPEITLGDVQTALYGVLALKPQVSTGEITLSGESVKVYTVTFLATGQEIADAAEGYRDELTQEIRTMIDEMKKDPDSSVNVVFSLHKGKLVQLEGSLEFGDGRMHITACLGSAPATQPLSLELETKAGEDLDRFHLSLDNSSDEDTYREKLDLIRTKNGIRQRFLLDCSYDLSSAEMDLTIMKDNRKANLRLHLAKEGKCLVITTQDISPLLTLFREKPAGNPAICTLTIAPGTGVTVPEYRNLDQWSMEDLLALFSGLGGLLGLKLP